MKSKKGFLLGEETLKIIVAVICLGFLVFLIVKLYYGSQDTELDQAKASLDRITKEISAGADIVEIYNPVKNNRWWITSWPSEGVTPRDCNGDSCLCICKMNSLVSEITYKNIASWCEEDGVCKPFDYTLNEEGKSYLNINKNKVPLVLKIDSEKKEITKA